MTPVKNYKGRLKSIDYYVTLCYDVSMNYTIYFQKEVWNRFQGEENKSNLINELLKKHYNVTQDYPKVQAKLESSIATHHDVIKTSEDAEKIKFGGGGPISKSYSSRKRK